MRRRLDREFAWFNENLPVPKLPRRDRRPIFWFRPGAGEPLRRMRMLATWLRAEGLAVHNVQTTHPGEVVYEDAFQVAALPPGDARWHECSLAAGKVTVRGGWAPRG